VFRHAGLRYLLPAPGAAGGEDAGGGTGVLGVVESAGGVDGVVLGGGGAGAVGGDAEGVRSPGRSPISVRDSEQPARTPVPRASRQTAVSNFFISLSSSMHRLAMVLKVQWECHGRRPLIH
jgi:hypothetical protein